MGLRPPLCKAARAPLPLRVRDERQRLAYELRKKHDWTLREIGLLFRMSRERARQEILKEERRLRYGRSAKQETMIHECFRLTNEELEQHNTRLRTHPRSPFRLLIATERIRHLRDGKEAKMVVANYCPFCGKRLIDVG